MHLQFLPLYSSLCFECDENKGSYILYIHSTDILKACHYQHNMQHVQGRQVKYDTCWQSITETSCTAGQTKQAMEGSGSDTSVLLPQRKTVLVETYW